MPRPSPQTERTLAAISLIAGEPDGLSLTELARRLDANTASCVHMLAAMADAGFVVRDATSRRYFLGPALIVPGQVAASRYPALVAARREMDELVRTTGLLCFAFARDGAHARLVHRAIDPRRRPPSMQLGDVLPITPPLGTVFAAWAPPEEIEDWLVRGGLAGEVADEARATLRAVRRLGYVVELVPDEPMLHELGRLLARRTNARPPTRLRAAFAGAPLVAAQIDPSATYAVSSISAPVFDLDGQVRLAVNALGLPAELDGRQLTRTARALRAATDRATSSIGGTPPPTPRTSGRRRPAVSEP